MTVRDSKGQGFIPGFLDAAQHTPLMTEGNLPGGGVLFALAPTRAGRRRWVKNPNCTFCDGSGNYLLGGDGLCSCGHVEVGQ